MNTFHFKIMNYFISNTAHTYVYDITMARRAHFHTPRTSQ